MRSVDFVSQYLPMCGHTVGTFNSKQNRGEHAFAFGIERRTHGGIMLDLDVVFHLAVEELTPAFTAQYAAMVVRSFSDELVKGIGCADSQSEPVFFMVAEYGDARATKRAGTSIRDKQRVGSVCFDGFEALKTHSITEVPVRVTLININDLLRRTRERAAKIGLDWSAPFFPPPDDPHAAKLIALGKKQREFALHAYHETMTQATGVQ